MEDTNSQMPTPSAAQTSAPSVGGPAAPSGSDSGYKKGGWKKWVWIYIVVAIVLYGGYYLLYMKDDGSSTDGTTNSLYGN